MSMDMSMDNDEQQILALHEAGDRALMSADFALLAQIFADDYVQYNESGKAFTKQDVLESFRSGANSATPRSCTVLNPTKWNPRERD